jgi:hypothetical protein
VGVGGDVAVLRDHYARAPQVARVAHHGGDADHGGIALGVDLLEAQLLSVRLGYGLEGEVPGLLRARDVAVSGEDARRAVVVVCEEVAEVVILFLVYAVVTARDYKVEHCRTVPGEEERRRRDYDHCKEADARYAEARPAAAAAVPGVVGRGAGGAAGR